MNAVTVGAGATLANLKVQATTINLGRDGKIETTTTLFDNLGRVSQIIGMDGTRAVLTKLLRCGSALGAPSAR